MSALVQVADQIYTIADVLTPGQCDAWIEWSESLGFAAAPVNTSAGPQVFERVWNNNRVLFDSQTDADPFWKGQARYRGWRLRLRSSALSCTVFEEAGV